MTKDSYMGKSLTSSKKAIVAVFAVVLLLFSAGAVVFNNESVNAETNEEVGVNFRAMVGEEEPTLVMEPDTTEMRKIFNPISTVGNFVVEIKDNFDTPANTCVNIETSVSAIKFVVDGNITISSSATSSGTNGIVGLNNSGYGTAVTIEGKTGKDTDKLTISVSGNSGGNGIKVSSLEVKNVVLDSSGPGTQMNFAVGIYANQSISLVNSEVIARGGDAEFKAPYTPKTYGIQMGNAGSISINDSILTALGGDIKEAVENGAFSYGILTSGSGIALSGNSRVYCDGSSGSIINNLNPTPVQVKDIKTNHIYASVDGKDYTEIKSEQSIDVNYKYVGISMNEMHTVTYSNGEGEAGEVPIEILHQQGDEFTVQDVLIAKAGYTFDGWNDGTKVYKAGDEYTMGAGNVTLTAQWKSDVKTHNVTYDLNGGSGTAPTQGPVAEQATFKAATTDSTKSGYTFGGWIIVGDSTQHVYKPGDDVTMGTADMTLKAVWNESPGPEPAPTENKDMPIICLCLVVVVIIAILALAWFGRNN